jgi:hypothetical protein
MKRTDTKMYFYRNVLVIFLVFNFCNGQQPADKKANAKTKATLEFIAGLPKQSICLFKIEYLFFLSF